MDKLHNVQERIERIESKLDKILHILESNQKSCDKMSKHIDFVDSVYDAMKYPLNTICNVVSMIGLNPLVRPPKLRSISRSSSSLTLEGKKTSFK